MRGAGNYLEFINIWLDTLTTKFNDYSTPVASNISTSVSSYNTAKLDSGATQYYIKQLHNFHLTNLRSTNGPNIQLPNKTELKIIHQGYLPLHPKLSPEATKAYILSNLKNESLLSVGQLCDHDCKVHFEKSDCDILHNNQTILKGTRNFYDGLYDIKLPILNSIENVATSSKKNKLCN